MKILAMVDYAHESGRGAPQWCKLRPLARAEGSRWEGFDDVVTAFPTHGFVFWPTPPPTDALQGSLWTIEVGESQRVDAPDRSIVTRYEPALAFLPVEGRDGSTLRRTIAEGSFHLYRRPPSRLFLSHPDKVGDWIGPFSTLELEADRLWKLSDVSGGFVDLLEVDKRHLVTLQDHPLVGLRVPVPGFQLPMAKGSWSVQDDTTLLSSLLKNVRRLDPAVADALALTQRVWRAYADSVAASGEEVDAHDLARLDAVAHLLEWHTAALTRSTEAMDALLQHPHVSSRIEAAIRQRVDDAKEVIKERAEAAVADLLHRQSHLREREEALKTTVAQEEAKLEHLRLSLQERRAAVATVDRELESEIREVVDRIAQDPIPLLANHLAIGLLTASVSPASSKSSTATSWRKVTESPVEEITEVNHLQEVVSQQAISQGFDERAALSLLAGWLSGRFVACRGERAFDFLSAIAGMLAGQRVWVIPIPARVFGVGDALSLPCSRIDGQGIATKLGDLLARYASDDHPTAIVLQGFNRAPPVHLMDDLLRVMQYRGVSGYLPWSDGNEPRVAPIPPAPAVLWCGTISEGTTCFPLPPSVSRAMHLADADRLTTFPESHRPPASPASRVALSALIGWARGTSLPRSLPSDIQHFAAEIAIMYQVFGDDPCALAEWLVARGVPLSLPKDIDQLARDAGQPVKAHLEELQGEGVPDRLHALIQGDLDA